MGQDTRKVAADEHNAPPDVTQVEAALSNINSVKADLTTALTAFRTAARMRPLDYFRFQSSGLTEPGAEEKHLHQAMNALKTAQIRIAETHTRVNTWTETTPSSLAVIQNVGKVQVAFQNLLVTIRKEPKTKLILAQLRTVLQTVSQTVIQKKN